MDNKTTIELPRLEREHPARYEARTLYVTMGPSRSLEAVSQKLAKSLPLMKRWSTEDNWTEHAANYDNQVSYLTINESAARHIADLEAHRAQAQQVGDALIGVGAQLVTQINAALKTPRKIKGEDGKIYTLHGIEMTAQTFAIAARALQTGLDIKAHALGVDSILDEGRDTD